MTVILQIYSKSSTQMDNLCMSEGMIHTFIVFLQLPIPCMIIQYLKAVISRCSLHEIAAFWSLNCNSVFSRQ